MFRTSRKDEYRPQEPNNNTNLKKESDDAGVDESRPLGGWVLLIMSAKRPGGFLAPVQVRARTGIASRLGMGGERADESGWQVGRAWSFRQFLSNNFLGFDRVVIITSHIRLRRVGGI